MAATTTAPANFLRLELIDFLICGDGGMGILRLSLGNQRLWRQRRGLRACGQRNTARYKSKSELQKVPALHDISSSAIG